ncbi:MAG TPA: hypothetical protein VGS07_21970 [Thermoanaerobaculia bacterium]|jgi:Tol biopolymer transport system component|nr:hypothetical protein [Thermoanaerobaculia bacterium]
MQGRLVPIAVAFAALAVISTMGIYPAGPAAIPEPELFGEGVLSTQADELGAAFTPDGKTLYFTLRSPTTTTPSLLTICVSHLAGGRWSEPEVAPFSGRFNDSGPTISPDGKRLFFSSDRPAPGKTSPSKPDDLPDVDLWVMERTADGWSEPRNLGAPVNTPAIESSPAVAADGTLYFASSRPGGKGSLDLYRSRFVDGHYTEPEPLTEINSEAYESQPAIAPDQSLLVFAAAGRPDALVSGGYPYAKGDLYVSFRTGSGWSPPQALPPPINSKASDSSPSFSPDGRSLFFTSERSPFTVPMPHPLKGHEMADRLHGTLSGSGNLYRIDLAAIRALAPSTVSAASGADPLSEPRLWGEGVISTRDDEFGAQLTEDGGTVFFDRTVPRNQLYTIHVSHVSGGRWSPPEVAPFSGTWRDSDPVLSGDGRRMFFVSDRPRDGKPAQDFDIWYVERTASGWSSEAHHLKGPPNSEGSEYFASSTRDGTLYFTSNRPGSKGGIDVWRSRLVDGHYAEPENLGDAINAPGRVNIEALVAPDESFLLVGAFGHPDGLGDCDLFVSWRKDGVWQPLQNLGPRVNSVARDYSPRLSPDGRTLFFASERGLPIQDHRPGTYRELIDAVNGTLNGLGNIYRIDLKAALGK